MTQLVQRLKAKTLISELSGDEFDAFLKTLIHAKGSKLIIRILCQHRDPSFADKMIQIASTLIQSRDVAQEQESESLALDLLPKSFIGEIATFLDQKSYASLSHVNTQIYIGCNDPNRLLSVSPKCNQWSSSTINLSDFPQMKYLSIPLNDSYYNYDFSAPTTDPRICRSLEALHLNNTRCSSSLLMQLLEQRVLSFDRLRTLSLNHFVVDYNVGCPHTVIPIFSKFHMIRHLHLFNVTIADSDNFPKALFKDCFPNLQSLSVHRSDAFGSALLYHRGSDLHRLELNCFKMDKCFKMDQIYNESDARRLNNIDFSKLRQFTFAYVQRVVVDAILKTATNLESVRCQPKKQWLSDIQKKKLRANIQKLMTHSESLTNFHFDVRRDVSVLDLVSDAIVMGLRSTQSRNGDILRIGVETDSPRQCELCSMYIRKILNGMEASGVKEYVLFWKMYHEYIGDICQHVDGKSICSECRIKVKKQQKVKRELVSMVDSMSHVELVRTEGSTFIIRNKGSAVNCYRKWWYVGKEFEVDLRAIY